MKKKTFNEVYYVFAICLFTAFLFGLIVGLAVRPLADGPEVTTAEQVTETTTEATTEAATEAPKAARAQRQAYYFLEDYEREIVEAVVMAEAGGEPLEGQMAVAQCILNSCQASGLRPDEVVRKYGYTTARPTASAEVCLAVSAVFDDGAKVTDEPIMYFYAPARCSSAWHESQAYVLTIGGHKFFKEA